MYKPKLTTGTTLVANVRPEGETIEDRVKRLMNNEEGLTDGSPLIFNSREEGVKPEHDIRSDKFDRLVEATDKTSRNGLSKRAEIREKAKEKPENGETPAGGGTTE